MTKCRDHGANTKPKCRTCTWSVAAVNQRWVEEQCRASRDRSRNAYPHKFNTYLRGAIASFDADMYEEGTP